jgi:hypothetical protein
MTVDVFWINSRTFPVPDVFAIETPDGSADTDQLKVVPETRELKIILACVPGQMVPVEEAAKVTSGVGLTVMVNVLPVPGQMTELLVKYGVTVMFAVTGVVPVLMAANGTIDPDPVAARPMDGLSLVQV